MVIKDVTYINFYRLDSEYRKVSEEITEIQKGICDLETMKLKLERKLLDLNEKLKKLESEILTDIEKMK